MKSPGPDPLAPGLGEAAHRSQRRQRSPHESQHRTPRRPQDQQPRRHVARRSLSATLVGAVAALCLAVGPAQAEDRFIVMASTTSTEQSGLFGHLLPQFRKASGIDVRVVALGTGQALDAARRGDADVVFVHDRVAEERFVAQGYGLQRRQVMFNDFVLVGPKSDPAGLRGQDIAAALARLARDRSVFVSRGDNSGTHAAELRYWHAAGVDLETARPAGYRACGCGMGQALNIAASTGAYVLADRGTWLNFRNRGDMAVLVEADQRLTNQYGVVVVNPIRHPHVRHSLAQAFADWVVSPAGQDAIAGYTIDGEPVFFPNASP
jgi:tungstate transport system substrate-binding protein